MLFLAFIALVFAGMMKDDDYIIDMDMIDKINKGNHGWTAGVNSIFVGKQYKDVKGMLGWLGHLAEKEKSTEVVADVDDDSFDVYNQWPNCKHPIRDQGQCGSCWAFSAAEAMSDRFCIAGEDVILSPQFLVSCENDEYGCNGGYLSREWEFLEETGTVSDDCFPYSSGGGTAPSCPKTCTDGSAFKYYKVKSYKHLGSVSQAQSDMKAAGSIQAAFNVYQDFYNYKGGVYTHQYGSLAGGHAIKIQGWGTDSTTSQPYWNVANSWGSEWGMSGYFWILRGKDECGIEDQMYSGVPSV